MFGGCYSRNVLWGKAAQKAWLFTTCLLLFVCFISLDMQMRCYQETKTVEINMLSSKSGMLATRAFEPTSNKINHRTHTINLPSKPSQVSSRKLSSHTESNFLYDLYKEHSEYTDEVQSEPYKDVNSVNISSKHGNAHEQNLNITVRRRFPQAIIIGVKKGGTRALLEILRLHPDVRAPGPEPHFFDRYYYKGLEWYRRQMPPSVKGQLTMEKTPSYLITPEVPLRVYNMSPDVRFLVVVRDPVTRAVSDYTQASSKRVRENKTFAELAFQNVSTGLVDTGWSAIRIGVYARHLERWLRSFPLGQFHFVSGERLISDPVAELQSVQEFLGLRPVISENHFFFNQTKGFPCLRRTPHSTVPHCLGKTKGRSHPYIPPSAIQRLRDFYRPFNQKFYKMVGRNFGWQ